MGAIEGLGKIAMLAAENYLQDLSQQQDEDEDIRKAAFRALRRSQRTRQSATSAAKNRAGDKV